MAVGVIGNGSWQICGVAMHVEVPSGVAEGSPGLLGGELIIGDGAIWNDSAVVVAKQQVGMLGEGLDLKELEAPQTPAMIACSVRSCVSSDEGVATCSTGRGGVRGGRAKTRRGSGGGVGGATDGVKSFPEASTPVQCVKSCPLRDLEERHDHSERIVPMSIVVVSCTGLATMPVAMTLLGVPCGPSVASATSRGVTRPSRMSSRGLRNGWLLRTVAGEAMRTPVPTIADARVSGGVIRRGLHRRTRSRGVKRSKLCPLWRPLGRLRTAASCSPGTQA
jgi:hypothetical protein